MDALIGLRILMFESMGTAPAALAATEWLAVTHTWFEQVLNRDDARILVVEARGQRWGRGITEGLVTWLDTQTDVRRVDLYATPDGARIYGDLGFVEHAFPAMQRPSRPRAR